MTNNKAPTIQIGQLNLRVPSKSAEVGERVANGVAESLAQQLPSGLKRKFGVMNLRVRLPPGTSEAEMSGAIAQSILNALQKGN